MKTGHINSAWNGRRVRASVGEHAGKHGTVAYTDRAPTFSQLVPYATRYGVTFDDGARAEYRKGELRQLPATTATA